MTSLELALGIGGGSSSSGGSGGPSPVPLLDNVARTLALTAMAWSKSAFVCGLLGTQPVKRVRLGLLALVGVLNAVVVGTVVFHWVRCKPLHKAWDVDIDGTCFGWGARNAVQITAQGECLRVWVCLYVFVYMRRFYNTRLGRRTCVWNSGVEADRDRSIFCLHGHRTRRPGVFDRVVREPAAP